MYCPRCGKMLELDEKKYCTGCGADVSGVERKASKKARNEQSDTLLPYGARYITGEQEMRALGLGLVLGAVLGFFGMVLYLVLLIRLGVAMSIGFGIIASVFSGILGFFIVSKISNGGKVRLAGKLGFIRTDGLVYHIVDFMCIRLLNQNTGRGKK